jgi:hypothetical protein
VPRVDQSCELLYQSGAQTSAFRHRLVALFARLVALFARLIFLFFRLAAVQPLLECLSETLAGRLEVVVGAPRLDLYDAYVIAPAAVTASVRLRLAERRQRVLSPSPQ